MNQVLKELQNSRQKYIKARSKGYYSKEFIEKLKIDNIKVREVVNYLIELRGRNSND